MAMPAIAPAARPDDCEGRPEPGTDEPFVLVGTVRIGAVNVAVAVLIIDVETNTDDDGDGDGDGDGSFLDRQQICRVCPKAEINIPGSPPPHSAKYHSKAAFLPH